MPVQQHGYGYNMNGYTQQQQQQQLDNERKRGYEGGQYDGQSSYNNVNGYSDKRQKMQGSGPKKYMGIPVVQCTYWKQGKCRKGTSCTFLHE